MEVVKNCFSVWLNLFMNSVVKFSFHVVSSLFTTWNLFRYSSSSLAKLQMFKVNILQAICKKEKLAIYKMSTAARGKVNSIIITCMFVVGPQIVFHRKRQNLKLINGAPPITIPGFYPWAPTNCKYFFNL